MSVGLFCSLPPFTGGDVGAEPLAPSFDPTLLDEEGGCWLSSQCPSSREWGLKRAVTVMKNHCHHCHPHPHHGCLPSLLQSFLLASWLSVISGGHRSLLCWSEGYTVSNMKNFPLFLRHISCPFFLKNISPFCLLGNLRNLLSFLFQTPPTLPCQDNRSFLIKYI